MSAKINSYISYLNEFNNKKIENTVIYRIFESGNRKIIEEFLNDLNRFKPLKI